MSEKKKAAQAGSLRVELKDYRERFIGHLKQLGRSPLTLKNYRSDLDAFLQWVEASSPAVLNVAKVSATEIEQYQAFLITCQKLKPNSINRRLRTVRSFYAWLQQMSIEPSDPLPPLDPLVEAPCQPKVLSLSQTEQDHLLQTVDQSQNVRDKALVKLLFYTGVRVGELCALRWSDIELSEHNGELYVRSHKIKSTRKMVLPPEACNALLELGYRAKTDSQEPVFVGQRGPMTARGVQEIVRKYAVKAGLTGLSPHMFRHVYATRCLARGMRIGEVAVLMGMSAETAASYEMSAPVVQERKELVETLKI